MHYMHVGAGSLLSVCISSTHSRVCVGVGGVMHIHVCAHLGGGVWKPEADIESLLFTLLGALRQGLLVNSTH